MDRKTYARASVAALAALSMALTAGPAHATAAPHTVHHTHHGVLGGDFDGDGRRDLALGAPGSNRVRVKYSHAHPNGSHVAWVTPNAPSVNPMQFGSTIAVGDFDGDGYADLAVGAPSYQPRHQHGGFENNPEPQGAVFVLYGSRSGLHHSPLLIVGPYDGDEPYFLGTTIAAGDINDDGYTDLAATLPLEFGGVHVYFGSHLGLRLHGEHDLEDPDVDSLAFGDVNGDGYRDLITGSTYDLDNPTNGDFGAVRVWNGRRHGIANTSHTIGGDQVGVANGLGSDVATGDLDGDGYADVVAGAAYDHRRGTPTNPGSIVVLFGGRHGLAAVHSTRISEHEVRADTHNGDAFGAAVDIAKVTGDRYPDVVVGAPGTRVGSHHGAGAVYFLRGSAHGVTLQHRQRFTQASAHVPGAAHTHANFGAVVFLAQLVGHANRDLVVSAPNESHPAIRGGFVVRLTGTASGISAGHAAGYGDSTPHDRLGTSIS